MNFDETYLATDIIESCGDLEATGFNETVFEYDDAIVKVSGVVHQDFENDGDGYWTPRTRDLVARNADLQIELIKESESRVLTEEEICAIELMIQNIYQ